MTDDDQDQNLAERVNSGIEERHIGSRVQRRIQTATRFESYSAFHINSILLHPKSFILTGRPIGDIEDVFLLVDDLDSCIDISKVTKDFIHGTQIRIRQKLPGNTASYILEEHWDRDLEWIGGYRDGSASPLPGEPFDDLLDVFKITTPTATYLGNILQDNGTVRMRVFSDSPISNQSIRVLCAPFHEIYAERIADEIFLDEFERMLTTRNLEDDHQWQVYKMGPVGREVELAEEGSSTKVRVIPTYEPPLQIEKPQHNIYTDGSLEMYKSFLASPLRKKITKGALRLWHNLAWECPVKRDDGYHCFRLQEVREKCCYSNENMCNLRYNFKDITKYLSNLGHKLYQSLSIQNNHKKV